MASNVSSSLQPSQATPKPLREESAAFGKPSAKELFTSASKAPATEMSSPFAPFAVKAAADPPSAKPSVPSIFTESMSSTIPKPSFTNPPLKAPEANSSALFGAPATADVDLLENEPEPTFSFADAENGNRPFEAAAKAVSAQVTGVQVTAAVPTFSFGDEAPTEPAVEAPRPPKPAAAVGTAALLAQALGGTSSTSSAAGGESGLLDFLGGGKKAPATSAAPVANMWDTSFLQKNQKENEEGQKLIEEEIKKASGGSSAGTAPPPAGIKFGAPATSAAPVANMWDSSFLQKNQKENEEGQKLIEEEIKKASGGGEPHSSEGGFKFGLPAGAPAAPIFGAPTSAPVAPMTFGAAAPSAASATPITFGAPSGSSSSLGATTPLPTSEASTASTAFPAFKPPAAATPSFAGAASTPSSSAVLSFGAAAPAFDPRAGKGVERLHCLEALHLPLRLLHLAPLPMLLQLPLAAYPLRRLLLPHQHLANPHRGMWRV
eukprot:gene8816-10450_t